MPVPWHLLPLPPLPKHSQWYFREGVVIITGGDLLPWNTSCMFPIDLEPLVFSDNKNSFHTSECLHLKLQNCHRAVELCSEKCNVYKLLAKTCESLSQNGGKCWLFTSLPEFIRPIVILHQHESFMIVLPSEWEMPHWAQLQLLLICSCQSNCYREEIPPWDFLWSALCTSNKGRGTESRGGGCKRLDMWDSRSMPLGIHGCLSIYVLPTTSTIL